MLDTVPSTLDSFNPHNSPVEWVLSSISFHMTRNFREAELVWGHQRVRAAAGFPIQALWLQSPLFFCFSFPFLGFGSWAEFITLLSLQVLILLSLGGVSLPHLLPVSTPSHLPPSPSLRCFSVLPATRVLGKHAQSFCACTQPDVYAASVIVPGVSSRPGLDKLQPAHQIWPVARFCTTHKLKMLFYTFN